MLSLQDSNSDKLNQNQMCYHYTKGQFLLLGKRCKITNIFYFSKNYAK